MSGQIKVFFILVAVAAAFQLFLFIPFLRLGRKIVKKSEKTILQSVLARDFLHGLYVSHFGFFRLFTFYHD